jgi:hypothetical protein
MFGGLAFLIARDRAVGVHQDELMVRVGKDAHDDAVALPGTRIFDLPPNPCEAGSSSPRTASKPTLTSIAGSNAAGDTPSSFRRSSRSAEAEHSSASPRPSPTQLHRAHTTTDESHRVVALPRFVEARRPSAVVGPRWSSLALAPAASPTTTCDERTSTPAGSHEHRRLHAAAHEIGASTSG